MNEIHVRPEQPADIQAIAVVNLSAFHGDAEAQLVTTLRDSPAFIPELSLVAEYKGRLVGHVMLTRVRMDSDETATDALSLGPMSVVPSQSYRGIGAILLNRAIEDARAMGFGLIVEVGQTDYYLRHGFRPLAEFDLRHSLAVDNDFITALSLQDDAALTGKQLIFPEPLKQLFGLAA